MRAALVSAKVIEALADVMVRKGVPEHLRSDNGPKFVARDLRQWLARTGAKTLYIEPGSPWENGFCESFNSKLRDEFLNGEIFYSMKDLVQKIGQAKTAADTLFRFMWASCKSTCSSSKSFSLRIVEANPRNPCPVMRP